MNVKKVNKYLDMVFTILMLAAFTAMIVNGFISDATPLKMGIDAARNTSALSAFAYTYMKWKVVRDGKAEDATKILGKDEK